jgi:hypothetical protein
MTVAWLGVYTAMAGDDAGRAMALLSKGTFAEVDATHVVHVAAPGLFVRLLDQLVTASEG